MTIAVCSCGEYGTAGCRHTNPHLNPSPPHRCALPSHQHRILSWECGVCGKLFAPTQFGFVEIRGATR